MRSPEVAMLLDNDYGPDPRVEMEVGLLAEVGVRSVVVAWDRRSSTGASALPQPVKGRHGEDVLRVAVPAPPGGGARSLLRMMRFSRIVYGRRTEAFPDASVLVAHDLYLLPLVALLARRLNKPFIYDAHEEFSAMEGARYPSWLLQGIERLESWLGRRARAVVVPGQVRVPRWRANGVDPIVMPNMGRFAVQPDAQPIYDVVYCGALTPARRLDLLIDLARANEGLRIGVAGRGREESALASAASELPNLDFHGWQADPDQFLASGRIIYYGLDPAHPYAEKACPNTLYQALRVRRPLLFFCGGEPAALASEFRIGVRTSPRIEDMAQAVYEIRKAGSWECEEAWVRTLERFALSCETYRGVLLAAVEDRGASLK